MDSFIVGQFGMEGGDELIGLSSGHDVAVDF